LLGKDLIHTYTIAPDGKSITCLRCKKASDNPEHVRERKCPYCHVYHDDLVPWARHWWINQPVEIMRCTMASSYQNERVSCQLREGHAGRHKGISPDGRILSWAFGRHQTCEMREEKQ
jgi:hypothetical protein